MSSSIQHLTCLSPLLPSPRLTMKMRGRMKMSMRCTMLKARNMASVETPV